MDLVVVLFKMLSSESSKTNRKDSCRLTETPTIETVSEHTAPLLVLDEVEETLVDIGAEDFGSCNSANKNECHEKLEEGNDIKSTLCLAPDSAAAAIAALVLNERLLAIANVGPARSIQQAFDVVLGTLEDDEATDIERRRTPPMQRWTSQLWSSDPWCILRMAPIVEKQNKRETVAEKNEQKTEEPTRDCLSSDKFE